MMKFGYCGAWDVAIYLFIIENAPGEDQAIC
jgi:hypothetical protein